ncbi:MAG: PIG-L family deacetylase [Candidatus Krumholzibacteria bacterium]|nr:PIG-L family deacetylase [Candidatus Krumholzibacteria bacterium]
MVESGCDLLCICPHSDDAEIALGGTLRLLADHGRRIWVCDLTRGELATNADPQTRWTEAIAAGGVLGLAGRVQLELPDGWVDPASPAQVSAVIAVLRTLRPRWVVSAPVAHRHPDHLATPPLVQRACFLARLAAHTAAAPPARWWPCPPAEPPAATWIPAVTGAVCPEQAEPDLLLDVSTTWQAKRRALACYASQFQRGPGRRPTAINDPEFMAAVEDLGRRWGRRAGVAWAEALQLAAVPVVTDLPDGQWA